MLLKIHLVNGNKIYYENNEVNSVEDFSKILNSKSEVLPDSRIRTSDIRIIHPVNVEDYISNTLKSITRISENLAFDRSKSMKSGEGYIVPINIAVEIDERTGAIKDIRLDGIKEYLLKHL